MSRAAPRVSGTTIRRGGAIAAATACLLITTFALAHSKKVKSLEIVHPWTAETRSASGLISMIIRNAGTKSDRLVAARAGFGSVRLVTTEPETSAAIEIPASGEVHLGRGQAHLAFDGLTRALVAYDTFPLVLTFEFAGPMTVEVMVEAAEPTE
ncbi:MAG: copper chaperone PCu(A)C [Hyphomicrobium sp.]